MEELHAIVHGKVQMVMFRDFTQRKARSLGITGMVKNISDGTVEVRAQGTRDQLEQLWKALHEGPTGAEVEKVDCTWGIAKDLVDDFRIIY